MFQIHKETVCRFYICKENNSLAKFVRDIDEIPLLPIVNHHAQAVRVTICSWFTEKTN